LVQISSLILLSDLKSFKAKSQIFNKNVTQHTNFADKFNPNLTNSGGANLNMAYITLGNGVFCW